MAEEWELSGGYFESCSCDYLCPCLPSNLEAKPTKGWCVFAMVFDIDRGRYADQKLDGLRFAVVGRTPDVMLRGGWEVGLIVDDRASPSQQQAIAAIASGQAGGPMANLGPLIGKFLGIESKPFELEVDGLRRSVSIPGVFEQSVEGVGSVEGAGHAMHIEGTMHPANSRLALARARRSHVHAFGIDWDDEGGQNNGHLAPFAWQGAVPAAPERAEAATAH